MDMMTNRSSPSMRKTKEQVHRQTIRSAHEEIRVRRRSRCGDEGLVPANLSLRHSRAARVFACFALIFFMKKNRARNLVQSPVQKLAEKGGFEPPRPLFGPAPLAGVCIRPLCHFSAEILPHAIAVDAYHRRDVLVSAVGSD